MSLLVDVEWVQEHRHEVVLLDATLPPVGVTPKIDTRARYLEAHLPGAVFFDIEALSEQATSLPHMLPAPERFAQEMAALGVPSEDADHGGATLVVYEQAGVFSAPRAWWMLRVMGAKDVRVLNGGLDAWQAAGEPVEQGTVRRQPATFHAALQSNAVASLDDLQQVLRAHGQVADARGAARFRAETPEPRPELQSGHMPGAHNVPYTDLVRAGRFKHAEEIAHTFASRGVDVGQAVVTTCGSGVTAAVLALGLALCGAKQVRLYDGSWAEYAAQPGATIMKGDN